MPIYLIQMPLVKKLILVYKVEGNLITLILPNDNYQ